MTRFVLAIALFAGACAAPAPQPAPEAPQPMTPGRASMSLMVRFLTGTFETIAQEPGLGDSTPQTLRAAPFWPERRAAGEYWLYAEYALRGAEAAPFRQRIYRFTENNGVITGQLFDLPGEPARFAGEWRKPAPFASFGPADLRERAGCRVRFLAQMDVIFNGGSEGTSCPSQYAGAHHDHLEFFLTSSTLRTLEVGRDPAGRNDAGPSGPSEFRKILQTPG